MLLTVRARLGVVLLAPASLCAAEPKASTAIRLRDHLPSLTSDEAKALTPAELGDALLAPGHLPVTDDTVGPQGMEPSPPPGGSAATRVKLFLQPVLGEPSPWSAYRA